MNPTDTPASPEAERPLDNFSNCHQGIMARLDAFAELPAMAASTPRASVLAKDTIGFFRSAVIDHHHEEEKELFPAVLAASELGAEFDRLRAMVDALTAEHRAIESLWAALEPAVSQLAQGHPAAAVDAAAVQTLVDKYRAHARLEEESFLPLAAQILGRRDGKLASLGLALHMRHQLRGRGQVQPLAPA